MRLRPALPALVAALGLLASACQLSLATDVAVAADGSGTFELAVAVDDELGRLLADAGVDLTLGLAEADAAATGWELEDVPRGDGRELRVRATFDEPEDLGRLVDELHAGLDEDDPAVLEDVELERDEDGRMRLTGRAGLALPATPGAAGTGVTFDADDLDEVLARDGGSAVRYDLRVTLPGRPVEHDADGRRGRTLTWSLPVGELRAIHAVSAPPTDRTWLLVGATFAVSAAAAAVLVVMTRRRGRRLAGERAERPGA